MNNYNALTGLAIFGVLLIALGLAIWWFDRKPKRGATAEPDRAKIVMHQRIRRLENE